MSAVLVLVVDGDRFEEDIAIVVLIVTTVLHVLFRFYLPLRASHKKTDSDVPANPYDLVSTRSLMVHVIKHIQFESPAVPSSMWWTRGNDPFQEKLEPTKAQFLEINPLDFYYYEFYDVEAELCGLVWRWAA